MPKVFKFKHKALKKYDLTNLNNDIIQTQLLEIIDAKLGAKNRPHCLEQKLIHIQRAEVEVADYLLGKYKKDNCKGWFDEECRNELEYR